MERLSRLLLRPESQNVLSWKGLTNIIKVQLLAPEQVSLKNRTMCLRALSKRFLVL